MAKKLHVLLSLQANGESQDMRNANKETAYEIDSTYCAMRACDLPGKVGPD